MPKSCQITDNLDDLGLLITAAIGLDTSWQDEAVCRDYPAGRTPDGKTPWHASINDEYAPGVSGREMVKAAKIVCYACPVQWECAEYAARGLMMAGTWGGLAIGELKWLQDQPNIEGICRRAQRENVPMQERVVQLRLGVAA